MKYFIRNHPNFSVIILYFLILNLILDFILPIYAKEEINTFEKKKSLNLKLKKIETQTQIVKDSKDCFELFNVSNEQNLTAKIQELKETPSENKDINFQFTKILLKNEQKIPFKIEQKVHKFTSRTNSTRADVVKKNLIRGVKRYF